MSREIEEMTQDVAGQKNSPKGLMGKFLLGAAILACPCHLPIYLVLFGGTALGGYLGENQLVFAGALTILFLLSLVTGLRMIRTQN